MPGEVRLRDVAAPDLVEFLRHQLDPEARRMAAFVGDTPADPATFAARWARHSTDPSVQRRTILLDGRVVGWIGRYRTEGRLEVTYWIDRSCWGRGVATRALALFLAESPERPLFARAAKDNVASLRVLEKCGFRIVREERGFAAARGQEIPELVLVLDPVRSEAPGARASGP
jgi:RimJ/RimL family protein N-acetyltransferase